jgi:hypothetical protein
MVRTVIAVLPSEVLSERLEAFRSEPFFSTDGRAVRGYSNDVPMRVVELADLPACNEPVVVNVDAGYFTAETDPPASARMLKERCPDVRMLILVGSVDEPEVTAGMRDALQAFAAAWRDK